MGSNERKGHSSEWPFYLELFFDRLIVVQVRWSQVLQSAVLQPVKYQQ